MALPVIADVFRVALNWIDLDSNSNAVNVMHIEGVGKSSDDLNTALEAHVTSAMWTVVANNAYVQEVDITPLDGSSATSVYAKSPVAKWTGVATTDSIPQVAGLLRINTALRGRSRRGRLFLPFLAEGVQNHGVIGVISTTTTAWTTFDAAMTADGFRLGVASYLHADFEPAVSEVLEAKTATQRRRQKR